MKFITKRTKMRRLFTYISSDSCKPTSNEKIYTLQLNQRQTICNSMHVQILYIGIYTYTFLSCPFDVK